MSTWHVHVGCVLDVLPTLAERSVRCCVTSPPYWGLRDYGVVGQIGLEPTPDAYVSRMVAVFREVRRVLTDDGTIWVNLGSSYASGDTTPNQPRSDARACGMDDTEPQGSAASGRACPCCGGELLDGALIRRDYTARTSQQIAQGTKPDETTIRDNAPSASTGVAASRPSSRRSTTRASFRRDRAACVPSAILSADQTESPTSSRCEPGFSHNSVCTDGTAKIVRPSSSHTSDTGLFCTACGYCTTTPPTYKPKDMVPTPWLLAMALQADGWYLRSDIIWHKPNPMPESVTDRPTKSHEYVFLLAKSERYFYDAAAIAEPLAWPNDRRPPVGTLDGTERPSRGGRMPPIGGIKHAESGHNGTLTGNVAEWPDGRNKRTVWTIPTQPYKEAHFATFPEKLVEPCILAGSAIGDTVLDPFNGSGTTGAVSVRHGRNYVGIELNPEYAAMARRRIGKEAPLFIEKAP